MHDALAYFLELRLRVRGRPEAIAIVDRCIILISRAATADARQMAVLEAEVERLRTDLEARFGEPRPIRVH